MPKSLFQARAPSNLADTPLSNLLVLVVMLLGIVLEEFYICLYTFNKISLIITRFIVRK